MLSTGVEALMRSLILAALLGSTLASVGCAAHVGYAEPSGSVDLVYAAPGVQVIADYDEPIFYSDGFYWRNYDGGWYRSAYYTGGWAVASPPMAVMRIDRPHRFVHYRPSGYVARPAPAPRYVASPPRGGWRGNAATPPPASGWRGNATAPPPAHSATPSGWRSRGPSSPQPGSPPPSRGWRGGDNHHGHGRR